LDTEVEFREHGINNENEDTVELNLMKLKDLHARILALDDDLDLEDYEECESYNNKFIECCLRSSKKGWIVYSRLQINHKALIHTRLYVMDLKIKYTFLNIQHC